jgi:hypothetical protein
MAGIPGLESFSFNMDSLGSVMTVVMYIFYGLILGLGIYLLIRLMKYNVIVEIMERTGDNQFVSKMDKGAFVKDKDNPMVEVFSMLREKRWKEPLDKSYLTLVKKGFGFKKKVVFAEDSEGRLQPVKPISDRDVVKFRGWDNNSSEFVVRESMKLIERLKKPDFMSKYGSLIQLGALALIFVMAIVLFRQIGQANEGFAAASAAFNTAAQNLAGLHSAVPIPPGQVVG